MPTQGIEPRRHLLEPLHSQSCESWGLLPSIQGAGSPTLPNHSPCGGEATFLWADLEQPEDADQGPMNGSSERVDLWSSWLSQCVLCVLGEGSGSRVTTGERRGSGRAQGESSLWRLS